MAARTIVVKSTSQPIQKAKRRTAPIILASFGLVAIIAVGGSTFAANIALNAGSDVEFGQGRQRAVTCDQDITVTPVAVYDASSDTWGLQVNLSGIDSSNCFGVAVTASTWTTSGLVNDTWTFTLNSGDSDWGSGWMTTPGNTAWRYTYEGGTYSAELVSTLDAADLKTITVETRS